MRPLPLLRAVVFVGLALAAPGCRRAASPPPLLRVGYSLHDHHAPLYVAALDGGRLRAAGAPHLAAEGARGEYALRRGDRILARVRLVATQGGKELARKLAEDQLDAAFGGFPALAQQIDQGAPLRIVAPTMTGGAGLVVRAALPARDWKGFVALARSSRRPLRIGYRIDLSVQKLLLEQALAAAAIPIGTEIDDGRARVVLVNLYGAENLLPALRSGIVDGFVGVQPFLAVAEEGGAGRVVTDLNRIPCGVGGERCEEGACGYPCCALAMRQEFGAAHPEVAESFVAMALAAGRLLAERPEETALLVSRWLGTPLAVERRSLPTISFVTEFEGPWDEGARRWIERMVETGELKGKVAAALRKGGLTEALYDRRPYDRWRRRT